MTKPELIALVMRSFEAERTGDTELGLSLLHPDFRVTEMNIGPGGALFRTLEGERIRQSVREVFEIKDRKYQFVTVAADEDNQTVVVEFAESYTDLRNGRRFRTPIVAVIEVREGLIYRTRHYTDDRLSDKYLSQAEVDQALS